MKRNLIPPVAIVFLLSLGSAVSAQDLAKEIVGVWKVLNIDRKEVATGKIDKPYGERPTGYYIYSRSGQFSWTFVAENRKPPAAVAPTDAERVELFKTMSFGTGTYKVSRGAKSSRSLSLAFPAIRAHGRDQNALPLR